MFKKFMDDSEAWNMYITGAAGTGKTTSLASHVQYCIDTEIPYVVCAYTHKACDILRSKLPVNANVKTLHSFLKKRPTINVHATDTRFVNQNTKTGDTDEEPKVLFLDEYSMIGEKDYVDIVAAQDSDYDSIPELKVVWIGDAHQLPPVKDQQVIQPEGEYQQVLTKQWRNDNPLQQPLNALVSYIDGTAEPAALPAIPDYFIRGQDIVKKYIATKGDKVLLAYTNKRVQELNEMVDMEIGGSGYILEGQEIYSPNTQHHYLFHNWVASPEYIDLHYSDPLCLGSKYRTLENLISSGLCQFAEMTGEDGEDKLFAVIAGHYSYKVAKEELEAAAVQANKAIESAHPGHRAAGWARANSRSLLARTRAKAWRDFLSFSDCVICVDFPYATTVHKSQGSTYTTVLIDTDDLAISSNFDFEVYLKLTYVAISRASKLVITN